jgi:3-hydroxy-9,10-secoandrosta-1,3,5(10)-triene-9,17-dione monooxygenase
VSAAPEPRALIERAIALRPALIEAAPETERRGHCPEWLHREFLDAGFYRMLVPRRYGGLEVDITTFLEVVIELAAGDVGAAWGVCLASAHAMHVATLFEEPVQAELFGEGDFRCPAVAAPAGSARRVEGGWEISGTWSYCSGAPYATHYLGQTFEAGRSPGQILLFIAPRSQWTMLDDWGDVLGLRGSGSQSIRIDAARLPAGHVLEGTWMVDTDTRLAPGPRLHGNPLYAGRTLAIFQAELGALAVGGVKGALERYAEIARTRTTQRPPIVARHLDPDYQRWYGSAIARVYCAQALLLAVGRHWTALGARQLHEGLPFTRADDLRLNTVAREALNLAWTAMHEDLFRTAGTSATRAGERMERIFRDVATDWGHFGNIARDWSARERARERLGLAPPTAARPERPREAASR